MVEARTFTEPDDSRGVRAFVMRVVRVDAFGALPFDVYVKRNVCSQCRSRRIRYNLHGLGRCGACGHEGQLRK